MSQLCAYHEDDSVHQHKGNFSPNCTSKLSNIFCSVQFFHTLLVNCHPCFLFALGKNTCVAVIVKVHLCSIGYEEW